MLANFSGGQLYEPKDYLSTVRLVQQRLVDFSEALPASEFQSEAARKVLQRARKLSTAIAFFTGFRPEPRPWVLTFEKGVGFSLKV
ncbi:MAG: hypothetical protein AAF639_30425, partial [Chloroflexota bacterium]